MTDYPNLTYIYWDVPDFPVSSTGRALTFSEEAVCSTPAQETKNSV